MSLQNQLNHQLKGLVKNLDKLSKIGDKAINSIPADQRADIVPLQAQLNDALRAVKKGDVDKLSGIIKKYDK